MAGPQISDHALLRFVERSGGMDIDALRTALAQSLARAHAAARSITRSDYLIRVDGMLFVVRGEVVTTVIEQGGPMDSARILDKAPR